jgi:hypothetical protein
MRISLVLTTLFALFVAMALPARAESISILPISYSMSGAVTVEGVDTVPPLAHDQVVETPKAVNTSAEAVSIAPSVSLTVYAQVRSAYVYNALGTYALDKPVVQSGFTVAHESGLWVDLWNSTPLSFSKRDLRGPGEETDLTIGYNTKLSKVELSGTVGYFAVPSYQETNDDIVELKVRAVVPLKVGPVTIRPYVQPYVWLGQSLPTQKFVRAGVDASIDVGKWSLSGDVSHEQNLTRSHKAIVPDRSVLRFDLNVSRDIYKGYTLTAGVMKSGKLKRVFGLGLQKTF